MGRRARQRSISRSRVVHVARMDATATFSVTPTRAPGDPARTGPRARKRGTLHVSIAHRHPACKFERPPISAQIWGSYQIPCNNAITTQKNQLDY